jgi:hypothetical protein
MAFQLADEMVEIGFTPNEDTYASLLIACHSEKNIGFKYAIEVRKYNHIAKICNRISYRFGDECLLLVSNQRHFILVFYLILHIIVD